MNIQSPSSDHNLLASTDAQHKSRFILIKALGYEFWDEIQHLISQLLLAELTGRTPIVLWGSNCVYRRAEDINAFSHFFQPVSSARLEDIPDSATFYPATWGRHNLHTENLRIGTGEGGQIGANQLITRPETVLVSDFFCSLSVIKSLIDSKSAYFGLCEDRLYALIIQKYLQPIPNIAATADRFYHQYMLETSWLCIDVPGADSHSGAFGLTRINAQYFQLTESILAANEFTGVYLISNSPAIINEFQARYGNKLLSTASCFNSCQADYTDEVVRGEGLLLEALVALKCDYFIGELHSRLSLAIANMQIWPTGFCNRLDRENMHGENLFLPDRLSVHKPLCRLCNVATEAQFSAKLLFKHIIQYYRCTNCGALQTEQPFWLNRIAPPHKPEATSKASSTLLNVMLLRRLFEILGIHPTDRCVDFGGGTGLFTRLMRDFGYNYFNCDLHGGELCPGFHWNKLEHATKLITLFEHAEHFVQPADEWEKLFASNPDYIIGTTMLYSGQGKDWNYLALESGQRVFFYAATTLAFIGLKYGRFAYTIGNYFILARQAFSEQTFAALSIWQNNLSKICNQNFQTWLRTPFIHAEHDHFRIHQMAQLRNIGARIAIDGVYFNFATGIPRVWKSLLAEWSANGFGEFLVVIDRNKTAPRFPGIRYVDAPMRDYANRQADKQRLQEICDYEHINLFTSTYYTTPLHTPAILMIHDMIPEVIGLDLSSQQWQEKHEAIRYCKHFLSVSQSSANDLMRFFPEISPKQIALTPNGTDFRTPSAQSVQRFKNHFGIDRPYFLLSGVQSSYKNAMQFFRAFAELGDERQHYAILCTNARPPLEAHFNEFIGAAKVYRLILSDEDLQCAFAGAIALVYPSRYEGFGLPVLEAMACSCPVITCNNSSLPEVAGDAAIYIDPNDIQAMLTALLLVQNQQQRDELIRKGLIRCENFSWRKMADQIQNAFCNCLFSIESKSI